MTEAEMNAKIERVIAEYEEAEARLKEVRARLIEVENMNQTLREMLVKEIVKHI